MQQQISYINGEDLYTTFGTFVTMGGYYDLLAIPETKEPSSNKWAEVDGVDVVRRPLLFKDRKVSLKFASTNTEDYKRFIQYLKDNTVNDYYFSYIGARFRLRFASATSVKQVGGLVVYTISFNEDIPQILHNYTFAQPTSSLVKPAGVLFNGEDLGDYGIHFLDGLGNTLISPSPIQKRMIVETSDAAGIRYDTTPRQLTNKAEMNFDFLMKVESMEDYWSKIRALAHTLTASSINILEFGDRSEIPVYYTSMKINKFFKDDNVTVAGTMSFCSSFYRAGTDVVLQTEDGTVIATEFGDYSISI